MAKQSFVTDIVKMFDLTESITLLFIATVNRMIDEKMTLKGIENEFMNAKGWLKKADGKPYSHSALKADEKLRAKMDADGQKLYAAFSTFRVYYYGWNFDLQKPVTSGKNKGTGIKVDKNDVPMRNKKGQIMGKPKAAPPSDKNEEASGDKASTPVANYTLTSAQVQDAYDKCRAKGLDLAPLREFMAYLNLEVAA